MLSLIVSHLIILVCISLCLPRMGWADRIQQIQTDRSKPAWKREATLGYNANRGNTEDEQLSGELFANRKTEDNELTVKADGYYATASRKMDAQQYGGLLRYAFSFGNRLAWYNFYKTEARHDRFANIDWRLTPSTGLGYWFADREVWKAMVEVGFGWERTAFRNVTAGRSELVLVPRAFVQKSLLGSSTISQELTAWPSLGDLGEYRLRSETVLTNPLTTRLSFRVNLIDAFESDPALGADRNDIRLISSFVYSF